MFHASAYVDRKQDCPERHQQNRTNAAELTHARRYWMRDVPQSKKLARKSKFTYPAKRNSSDEPRSFARNQPAQNQTGKFFRDRKVILW
jgi:hypothetical protein